MEEDGSRGPLFEGVTCTVIPHDDLDTPNAPYFDELVQTLQVGGARYIPVNDQTHNIEELESLTHIISPNIHFTEYERALDRGIDVVKPGWVVASVRKQKQASARQYSPDPAQFFSDVVVTCAGLPESDQEAIYAGVITLGGQVSGPLTKLVTHIIALDLDHERCQTAEKRRHPAAIVLPHWFHDCLMLGKKIKERPYRLPDPEILRPGMENVRPKAVSSTPHLQGAITASPTKAPNGTPPPSPSERRKNLNLFAYRNIFLSADLQIHDDLRDRLGKIITHGGGIVTSDIEGAHIYVGELRQGADYVKASQNPKTTVGNLAWLYSIIQKGTWANPLGKLLHYPLPPGGIKGFENLKISLSNYSGDARNYVENLIKYCGAEYTRTMKQDNTHLITAYKQGEKCEAAQEWNITVLNHLWLEESFATCRMQAPSNPKYIHFPARTNLGEVTGQTSLDMKAVERIYFPQPKPRQKGSPRKTVPGSSTKVAAPPTSEEADQDIPTTITEADEADEMEVEVEVEVEAETEAPQTAKKRRGRPPKSSMLATPGVGSEKENDSPMLMSTGRASKTKALSSLQEAAADIAQYNKEVKRKGGVTHGRSRSSLGQEASSPAPMRNSKKRSSDEYDVTAEGSDLSDGETQDPAAKGAKRAKHSGGLPPIEWRMMVTGDDRWLNNPKKEAADRNTLRNLGVLLTQDPKDVDILVAPKMLRTKKFVAALACGPLVVDTSYLDTALNKKKLVENPPLLEDVDAEERYGFVLSEAIARAKINKHKLFRGWDIFVTKDIRGGFETYKDIIHLNGGIAMMYQGRNGVNVSKRQVDGNDDEPHVIYLVSGTSSGEIKLWKKFREEMAKQGLESRIVESDWVLNAAMSQVIDLDGTWQLDEENVMSQRNG